MVTGLTPCNLSPRVCNSSRFGVERIWRRFLSLANQFVALPQKTSRRGLYCGIFRKEPAIARLDGLFTPRPRSKEHFDCSTPSDLHSSFGQASPCPGLDRRASGLAPVTPCFINTAAHATKALPACRFRFGSADEPLNLATETNSPLSYSKLTLRHRLVSSRFLRQDPFHAAADYGC